ncbi:glycosyltransferase family 8 protein [Sphaerobolus stellatus SS14]|uniref:Glycosyltransferase family 8 protein n=1 Tax=Sphaerobolus stellatus (strain SS14) TaxID=990650 RepID=A0A0C9V3A4_SPHS4|nr:glycosyltransferase family 8 protein [Sphaerobolus stellatus SS14]
MSEPMLLKKLLVSLTLIQGGQSVLIALPVLAVMWAIGVSQTHRYYKTYREDPMLLKYFIITTLTSAITGVVVLVLLDVGGTILIVYDHFCRVAQTISFTCTVACDRIISLSLAFFLNRRKKETIKSTQNAVLEMMLYALNIGLVTFIFTLVDVVTWRTTSPERFTWVIFYSWTGGIYFNSVLVSLNARASIRSRLNAHIPTTLGKSLLVFDIDVKILFVVVVCLILFLPPSVEGYVALDVFQHLDNLSAICLPDFTSVGLLQPPQPLDQHAIVIALYTDGYLTAVLTLGYSLRVSNITVCKIRIYIPGEISQTSPQHFVRPTSL